MPLTLMRPGDKAKVVAVRGGCGCQSRLASMGILPDAEVRMIGMNSGGPVILEARGVRVALGRSVSHRVMVQPLS